MHSETEIHTDTQWRIQDDPEGSSHHYTADGPTIRVQYKHHSSQLSLYLQNTVNQDTNGYTGYVYVKPLSEVG